MLKIIPYMCKQNEILEEYLTHHSFISVYVNNLKTSLRMLYFDKAS